MYLDELLRKETANKSILTQMGSTEEIADKIREMTLDKLEEQTEFLKEFPNPIYATMRLEYLAQSEEQENFQKLIDLYENKELVNHLMETQKRAIQFMRAEKPKMMESWGLSEELKQNNPTEYEGLMNNLVSSLKEITIKEVVEI